MTTIPFYRFLALFGLIFSCAAEVPAQTPIDLEFGIRAGIPLTVGLKSTLTGPAATFSSQAYERSTFTAGPTFGATLYRRVTVEIDAIYKPIRFQSSSYSPITPSVSTTRGYSWEFPLIALYHFGSGSLQPYGGGGTVLTEHRSGTTETETTDTRTGGKTRSTYPYQSFFHQTPAWVVDGGLEWSRPNLVVRPGLRYTHWSDVGQSDIAVRTTNQLEFLVGLSFRN